MTPENFHRDRARQERHEVTTERTYNMAPGTFIVRRDGAEQHYILRLGEYEALPSRSLGRMILFFARLQNRYRRIKRASVTGEKHTRALYENINCHRAAIGPLIDDVARTYMESGERMPTFSDRCIRAAGYGVRRIATRYDATYADLDWWYRRKVRALPVRPDDALLYTPSEAAAEEIANYLTDVATRHTEHAATELIVQICPRPSATATSMPRPLHSFIAVRDTDDLAWICFEKKGLNQYPFRITNLTRIVGDYVNIASPSVIAAPRDTVRDWLYNRTYAPRGW